MLRARCACAPTTPARFGGCMSVVVHVTAQTGPLLWWSAHQEQAGLGSQTSTSRSNAGQNTHSSAPGGAAGPAQSSGRGRTGAWKELSARAVMCTGRTWGCTQGVSEQGCFSQGSARWVTKKSLCDIPQFNLGSVETSWSQGMFFFCSNHACPKWLWCSHRGLEMF